MRNPSVYVDPESQLHRAVIELQDLVILHRQHIMRLDDKLDQLIHDAVNAEDRVDRRFQAIRREIDQLKGVHGI